jgi:hypothetical protein
VRRKVVIQNTFLWGITEDFQSLSYGGLQKIFNPFPKYHMKVPFGDFTRNAKFGKEAIFKPTIWNESLYCESKDNGVRIINFATTKSGFKSTMFQHRNIHKYTWNFPDGKTHNQIDHILKDRRWHSSILNVISCRRANCDTNHYLVVAKFRERLAVRKQAAH